MAANQKPLKGFKAWAAVYQGNERRVNGRKVQVKKLRLSLSWS